MFYPFLGTGTTIDAAIQLHRFGIGCECDKECEAISERLWNTAEKVVAESKFSFICLEKSDELEIEEDIDDQYPDNNCPEYVNALMACNCSNEQILRFDAGRFVDLKIKQSSFLKNEKGLFADCDIPEGIK